MEQIFLAYVLPKETIAAIMMLYKNTKVKVLQIETETTLTLSLAFCKGIISPIPVHNLPRLRASNIDRSHERK